MQKKTGLFLIVAFLAVQMLSLLHMAEHGFEQHEHDDVMCDVYMYHQQAGAADIPHAVILPERVIIEARVQSYVSVLQQKSLFRTAVPRAPPLFLLS